MVTLAVDILVTPMSVFGFDMFDTFPWFTVGTTTFWTVDLFVQSMSGYYFHGVLELRPKKILRRYLKRGFLLDVALVVNDWLYILSGSSASISRLLRLSKGIRVV